MKIRIMQVGDRAAAAHQKPAPDHRTDLANPYVEQVNLCAALVCHRGFSLAEGHRSQLPLTITRCYLEEIAGRKRR